MPPTQDLGRLLSSLQPTLDPGRYAFVSLPGDATLDHATVVASIREPEGLSVVMPEAAARAQGLDVAFSAAWITLGVNSDLAAVGLTAAFASALGRAGISCNVVAGTHHDHLFVPFEQADAAMTVLQALQHSAAG